MNLPQYRTRSFNWVVPAFALIMGGSLLASHASASPQTIRNFLFIGGPLFLFSDIHDRMRFFLHTEERYQLLHNPISTQVHWKHALQSYWRHLLTLMFAGIVAIVGSQYFGGPQNSPTVDRAVQGLYYSFEWIWLCVCVGLMEPAGSAFAALAGRRYRDASWVSDLQQTLNNGWTTAEATIHLYMPACTLAIATLIALPGQLTIARTLSTSDLRPQFLIASLAPMTIALLLRFVWASRAYATHTWHAVPWLEEAKKSLGSPEDASRLPFWIRRIHKPLYWILAVQLFRLTPTLHIRLILLLGFSMWSTFFSNSFGTMHFFTETLLIAWWILPIRNVIDQVPQFSRLGASLPISVQSYKMMLWGWICLPTLISIAMLVGRFTLS